jgi:DNA mismatch repair protein MutS2
MPISARHAEALEFPKVLALLRRHASFSASASLADALAPSTDYDWIVREQETVAEARRLLEVRPNLVIRGAHDIRQHVHHAALGGALQPWQLLEIASTVAAGRATRNLLLRDELRLPTLAEHAARIVNLDSIEHAIREAIDDEGVILDSASPRLGLLRSQLRTAHERVLRRLNEMMAAPNVREALQEPVVTIRGGRYVLPVKADFRGRVRGIVHDQSGSGATLFIEPLGVVELANHWRELQSQEEEEIEQILRDLSLRIGRAQTPLVDLVEALATIDLAIARAKLAAEMRAERPTMIPVPPRPAPPEAVVDLRQARHPLLHGEVVPIDVQLGRSFDILLISGPNTGGKTVALKTVGLFALMAQAGLQVPANPGSRLGVFSGVFADIGDEQSIEQSLSTFSSHVSRVIEIISAADASSLVLLDEIGAGTDPQEGSALGRSLLAYLARRRVYTVATTHSSELKTFAATTPRVENASVQFDVETLRPTYHLTIGLPGVSNALTIAERLGMPTEIIEGARRSLDPDERRTDELLGDIHEQLAATRAERAEIAEQRLAAEATARAAQQRLAEIEAEREGMLRAADNEARAMIADLERELDSLRRQVRGLAAERQKVAEVEAELAALRRQRLGNRAARPAPPLPALRVGDPVTVSALGTSGILRSDPSEGPTAEVEVGGMRVRVPVRELVPAGGSPQRDRPERPKVAAGGYQAPISRATDEWTPTQGELDLRGMTADEARARLDQYLSDAYTEGLAAIRVIHGKGAGILREVVRDLAGHHPLVQSHRLADAHHGGEGATEITLAARI